MSLLTNGKVMSSEPLAPTEGKWIKLVKLTYNDHKNETRTWESAERTTRAKGSGVDGVGILAILEKPAGPEILLQKQFRPPLNQITIELPAGLVDEGESVQEAAVRELKEETGFVGTVSEISPVMFNDPGMTNTNTAICSVQIDTTSPENQDPSPSLEEDEFIETFTTPLATLYAECKRLEAAGYAIDARVGTFAQGIELAKRMNL
ncbi:ADP-ribose pyrophosphatase [Nemania serpens]|nr:ADP-ribose pyrophosphatase [Nemania serpens]